MLSGVGKAFCAGGDIVSLYKARTVVGADQTGLKDHFKKQNLLNFNLANMKDVR